MLTECEKLLHKAIHAQASDRHCEACRATPASGPKSKTITESTDMPRKPKVGRLRPMGKWWQRRARAGASGRVRVLMPLTRAAPQVPAVWCRKRFKGEECVEVWAWYAGQRASALARRSVNDVRVGAVARGSCSQTTRCAAASLPSRRGSTWP
jgi:hypothetical protein